MAEPEPPDETGQSPEARAYRRGFRQKNKRDDHALDLFEQARAGLGGDLAGVDRVLRQLSKLYNPLTNGPIIDLPTRGRIMELLEAAHVGEAERLLDARYRLYAPIDDGERGDPVA